MLEACGSAVGERTFPMIGLVSSSRLGLFDARAPRAGRMIIVLGAGLAGPSEAAEATVG